MFKKSIFCILFTTLVGFVGHPQKGRPTKIPDSLWNKTYKELEDIYLPMGWDSLAVFPYIEAHMAKAKYEKDSLMLVWSYADMGMISSPAIKDKYADSILLETMHWVHKDFPASGYYWKASLAYKNKRFRQSLEYYLKAYKSALKSGNIERQNIYRSSIANLKSRFGNFEEAREIYFDRLKNFKDSTKKSINRQQGYSSLMYNIQSTYLRERRLDSAEFYLKKGLEHSKTLRDSSLFYRFYSNQGVLAYFKGDYSTAISILTESLPSVVGRDICMNHYYRGKSYMVLDSIELAIKDFIMVDSLSPNKNSPDPQLADSYKLLVDYYGKKGDFNKQLHYINKLITIDSIIITDYSYINKTLRKEYDIPEITRTKEKIIAELNKKNRVSGTYRYVFLGVIVLLAILYLSVLRRQRVLKERFQKLMDRTGQNKKPQPPLNEDKDILVGVSDAVLTDIREKLAVFEQEKGYLSGSITLSSLAKNLGTNASYLSKAINYDKHKNFSSYLNDLRISFAVKRLKEDAQFRKFTIKSIAGDIGFNNPESFSKTFKKVTGLYPSYYIRQLEKGEA